MFDATNAVPSWEGRPSVDELGKARTSLYAIARECWEGSKNDKPKAIDAMVGMLAQNADLLREFSAAMIDIVSRTTVQAAVAKERKLIVASANRGEYVPDQKVVDENRRRVEEFGRRSLMNFTLRDGSRLADATREQIRETAEMRYKHGSAVILESKWLALVAAKLPDDKTTVRKALTEKALHDLREKARRK